MHGPSYLALYLKAQSAGQGGMQAILAHLEHMHGLSTSSALKRGDV
jgi:hypothetical protein